MIVNCRMTGNSPVWWGEAADEPAHEYARPTKSWILRHYQQYRMVVFASAVLTICTIANAAIINVTTNDNYTKIESANPGDEVLIAPGTY